VFNYARVLDIVFEVAALNNVDPDHQTTNLQVIIACLHRHIDPEMEDPTRMDLAQLVASEARPACCYFVSTTNIQVDLVVKRFYDNGPLICSK
jgi:hypothetical protein